MTDIDRPDVPRISNAAATAPVVDGPRPVFARATDTDRAAVVAAVRAALTNPADPLRRRAATLPPAPLDVDALDITDRLRQRLVRARENGFTLPTGVKVWTEDGDEWNRIVYPDDAGRTITCKTRFDDTLFAVVEAVAVFVVIVMLGSVIAAGARSGGWPTSADMLWTLLAASGTATAIVGLTAYSRRRVLRYGLTHADIDTFRAALVAHHRRDTVTPGDREAALASIAATGLRAITTSAAWGSGYLDLGRAVLDPDAELTEIRSFAAELHAMRTRLGTAPVGNNPAAAQARTHHAERLTELDTVFTSLVERVAALHHYATVLADLSDTITALDSIEQSRVARWRHRHPRRPARRQRPGHRPLHPPHRRRRRAARRNHPHHPHFDRGHDVIGQWRADRASKSNDTS